MAGVAALLLAAGEGKRLAAGRPKGVVEVAGRPLFWWALEALLAAPSVEGVVVALPPTLVAGARERFGLPARVAVVAGGAARSLSTKNALAAAPATPLVLVHDAARPLVAVALVEAVVAAAAREGVGGAVAAAPVTDTIRVVEEASGLPYSREAPPRALLRASQTPQVFKREALVRALGRPLAELAQATDEALLVEREGERILLVESSWPNPKVTTALELSLCAKLLAPGSAEVVESPPC